MRLGKESIICKNHLMTYACAHFCNALVYGGFVLNYDGD